MRKNNKLNKGFTLVEMLVAISIFTISILGMMSVLGSSIANTNYAKRKIIATYLAQEGIEYIRNMRDTYVLYPANGGWVNFRAKLSSCNEGNECGINNSALVTDNSFIFKCSGGCKLYLNNGGYSSSGSTDSGFVREIWAKIIDKEKEIKIFSKVEWTQGSGTYNITFSENLFNWYEI